MPGWFGPSHATQAWASRMLVVVPPSLAGTPGAPVSGSPRTAARPPRSEEHTSELQSRGQLRSFPCRRSSVLDAGVGVEDGGGRAAVLGGHAGRSGVRVVFNDGATT